MIEIYACLVARWLDLIYTDIPEDRTFGGIVTFGTPHHGSFLATEKSEALVKELAEELCVAFTTPQTLEALDGSFLVRFIAGFFINSGTVEEFVENGCQFLSQEVFIRLLAAQNKNIRNDYVPGAPALTVLNDHDRNNNGVPAENKVAFYGVENEPVLWNTANALMNNPELKPVFSAGDDGGTAAWAMDQKEEAAMKLMEWETTIITRLKKEGEECSFPKVLLILPCKIAENRVNRARNIRNSWESALNFWNTANDKYKIAIGALEIPILEDNTVCLCEGSDPGGSPGSFSITLPGACPEESSCRTVEDVVLGTRMYHPSDGVVLESSAKNYPGAAKAVKMDGSNHQQMRNDINARDRLNELWGGTHGSFFETPVKQ